MVGVTQSDKLQRWMAGGAEDGPDRWHLPWGQRLEIPGAHRLGTLFRAFLQRPCCGARGPRAGGVRAKLEVGRRDRPPGLGLLLQHWNRRCRVVFLSPKRLKHLKYHYLTSWSWQTILRNATLQQIPKYSKSESSEWNRYIADILILLSECDIWHAD